LHTLTGNFRLHQNFHSRHLPDDRDIIVYLPPGYDAPGYEGDAGRRYPVLYLHDGQNMFDAATAFGGQEWRADETAEHLIREGEIEPVIMVGIYNTGEHRIDEYTPARDAHGQSGGKARFYAAMIIEELKPFIDREYRTIDTREATGMGGSSLGGLVTLYVGMRHPEIFGKLAVLSPSVWWRNGVILRMIRDRPIAGPRPKIWLDIGTAEGNQPARLVQDTRRLRDVLLRQGWKLDEDLAYFEDVEAAHNEAAWSARLPRVLRFLFGKGEA
jgi:predicted alpha/beta superfamily hydrolase